LNANQLLQDADIKRALLEIQKVLDATVNNTQGPTSYFVSIQFNNQPLFQHGGGETTLGNKTPPIYESIFLVASVSKVFTTLGLLSSVASGKLQSLDVPVNKVNPNFKVIPAVGTPQDDPITFRHLATQMSGLMREVCLFVRFLCT
jgi:CubicO group peptidase (beta-lactamase class C family)